MNETINTLLSRRSIRSFTEEQVSEEQLQAILQAGLYAPTARGEQPWHFVVVQNPGMINRICEECNRVLDGGEAKKHFFNAKTLIVVFCKKDATEPVKDGSLAIGNMSNAAAALGLGSCWVNRLKDLFAAEGGQSLRRELLADDSYTVIGTLVVGYPAGGSPAPRPRREGTVSYIR